VTSVAGVTPHAFQPSRLRLARALRALLQKNLAEQVGVTPAAISQYESGEAVPGPDTVERLAVVLGCAPEFFERPVRAHTSATPFFRSRRSTSQLERDRAAAYASALGEIGELLERYVLLPAPRFDIGIRLAEDAPIAWAEQAAGELRIAWGIPGGPVPNVVRTLEARGALVAAVGAFDARLDAFSVRTAERPVVVLCSQRGNMARRRFDAAHECAHLVLHDCPAAANRTQEDQAQRFAAALLMPADEVEPWLPRRSNEFERLEEGSRIWGVSMQALLYRAQTVGTLSPHAYQRAMQRISAAGWRRQEPVEFGPAEAPELLQRAIDALADAGTTLAAIATEFGIPAARLARMLRRPEDRDDATQGEVVSLRPADPAHTAI
jgi:Zn-dependent peptidase ImmA (M78 family)/DNA-binding XRE family transcriptional regulator